MRTDGQTPRRTGSQRDRQTDMTKLAVALGKFANAPKNMNEAYCVWRVTSCNLTDGTDDSEESATAFFGLEK